MRRTVGSNKSKKTKNGCKTRKVRYRDHTSAAMALRVLRERSNHDKIPVRVYECPICKGWHLTSKDF